MKQFENALNFKFGIVELYMEHKQNYNARVLAILVISVVTVGFSRF